MKRDLKVLLVEDNADDEKLLKFALQQNYKLQLIRVETEEDYLKELDPLSVDIIISDYSLPTFDGMSALEIREKRAPLIPFILVTGSINEATAVDCMKAGADDYILKEHLDRLIPSIKSAIIKKENQKSKLAALEANRKSEETFLNIFNNTVVAIYILDKDIKFLEVNQAALDFYGYDKDELIGQTPAKLDAPGKNDLEKIISQIHLAFEGQPQKFEFWAKRKDGSIFPKLVTAAKGKYFGEEVVFSYAIDISERKKAEEQIKESEAYQKALVQSSPIPFFSIDFEGNIVTWNDAAEKVFGWSAEEIIGKPNPIVPDDKNNEYKELIRIVQKGKGFSGRELTRQTKDGRLITVSLSTSPIYDATDNNIGIMASAENITQRKKNEERIKLLSRAVSQSPVVIVITDPEGYIEYINPAFTRVTGHKYNETIGKKPNLLKSGYHSKDFFAELWETILKGEEWTGEIRNKRKDGTQYWASSLISPIVDPKGNITHFIEVSEDISKRKETEYLIKQQNELLNVMFDKIPVMLTRYEPNNDKLWLNKEFENKIGYQSGEIALSELLTKIYPDPQVRETAKKQIAASDSSWKEFEILTKDGNVIPSRWSDIRLADGTLISIGIDLTEQKEHEAELIQAKEIAESADKLKTEFLAQMSHEIRTPINVITGNHNLIKEFIDEEFKNEFSDIFHGVDSASRRIIRTIDLILNMSELQTGIYEPEFEDFSLEENVFHRLVNEFKPSIKLKNLELSFENNLENDIVHADQYSTLQIFSNLIDNAVKYTKEGSVLIKSYKNNDGKTCVDISDTGIGMSEEFMNNLFQPFSQEEKGYTRTYEGNGLGLALVKRYCDLNNAEIEVESKKDVGSTFRIIFN